MTQSESKVTGMRWVKADPKIGDYYYCKIDTKQDAVIKVIVEWAEYTKGETSYWDWDLDHAQDIHGNGLPVDAEVIEWLDESTPQQTDINVVQLVEQLRKRDETIEYLQNWIRRDAEKNKELKEALEFIRDTEMSEAELTEYINGLLLQ